MTETPIQIDPAIAAVVQAPSIQQPQLSPNGAWLLYTRRQGLIPENSHQYSLWVAATDGSSEPTCVHNAPASSDLFGGLEAEWSDDSSRIAVVASGALLIIDVPEYDAPTPYPVPVAGALSGLAWSPNGDQVAFLHTPPAEKRRYDSAVSVDLEKVFFRNVVENTVLDAQYPEPAAELWTLDLASGTAVRSDEPAGGRGIHWAGGKAKAGPPPGASRGIFDPSGKWLAQASAADWFSSPTLTELTDESAPVVGPAADLLRKVRMAWTSNGSLLFATDWHMARHLFRLTPGGEPERLTPEGYNYDAFSARGGQIAFVRENPVEPPNVFVIAESDLLGGDYAPRQLTHEPPAVTPAPRLSRVSWDSEGTEIEGYLVLPAEGIGEVPYPTLVDIQGGPTMVRMSQWSHFPNALFASLGYAVFVPGSRGRFGGYDKEFCHHIETSGFQLRDPLNDVLAGVEVLVGQGLVDPERVGISGHSYGAVLTSYAITQTDRFRAASFHEGMVEQFRLLRLYGASQETLAAMKHITGYGSPYDLTEAARIRQESPIDNMHTARVPTLIEAGEESLAYDAILLANALGHHGVPYELNLNPRTKHVVFEPKLFAEAVARNVQWFDYWLRDAPYAKPEKQAEFDEWKARRAGL